LVDDFATFITSALLDSPRTTIRVLMGEQIRAIVNAADDSWISTISKISPVLSGVGTFGSFINSVIAARQTAEFQKELISALQTIESDLEGIKQDLDAIYQELKNIETEIAGLGLNDKLTSIETWGLEMAALDPNDKAGAANLATAMMDASQGATNLLGCMIGLHNALVGQNIGKSLISLLDANGFMQIRARLVQGLHLLAFGCAFNTAEQYDYSVFLLQWAGNFEEEAALFFAANKDYIPNANIFHGTLSSGDTIALYQVAQSSLPNVALAVEGNGQTLFGYTGTLGCVMDDEPHPFLGFPAIQFPAQAYFDLINNQSTTDPNSPLARQCDPLDGPDQWLFAYLHVLEGMIQDNFAKRGKLLCGARFDPNQTFLGAVNGQLAWVGATDQTTYLCSIHDGNSTAALLLAYDATKGTVSAVPFSQLQRLTPVLWVVAWVSKDVVTISASQAATAPPAFLALDASGNWTISSSPANLNVTAAKPTIGPIINPFKMPATTATVGSAAVARTRTALFHQL
jgi:hypothetical protein